MPKYIIPILLLEYPINQMTTKQLHLYLGTQQYILVYVFMGFGKYMTYDQSVWLFEL